MPQIAAHRESWRSREPHVSGSAIWVIDDLVCNMLWDLPIEHDGVLTSSPSNCRHEHESQLVGEAKG